MKDIIKQLEEELRQAMLSSNVEKLDTLIADSLVFTIPDGKVINKKCDLEIHRSGKQKLSKLKPSEQCINLYENIAVVTVKMDLEGEYEGSSISGKYCYTRIWSNNKNRWQLIAGHVSQMP